MEYETPPSGDHCQVFVYGTLMRGQRHADYLASSRFLGARTSPPRYRLVLIDYYPAMVAGGSRAIHGELYVVSAETMRMLDELEEHPEVYQRAQIVLQEGERAWCYLLPSERVGDAQPLDTGDFRRCPRAL